ncbi:MAG: DUF2007 domain-containing protein [Pirellulales bacterium]
MAIRDPVAVYNAANNLEATLLCEMLQAGGIEAHAVEDVSQVGAWMFGLLPEIHKPQVWIERADIERAEQLLEEFERQKTEKLDADGDRSPVEVVCEECKKASTFPASRLGTVETCPHCGAFVDVGDDAGFEDWKEIGRVDSEST